MLMLCTLCTAHCGCNLRLCCFLRQTEPATSRANRTNRVGSILAHLGFCGFGCSWLVHFLRTVFNNDWLSTSDCAWLPVSTGCALIQPEGCNIVPFVASPLTRPSAAGA